MSLLKSSDQASRDTFERHSDFYDNSNFINSYLDRWDREILALRSPSPLLDIGCGPGRLLGKLLGAGYADVNGIDITKNGLLLARRKALSKGGSPGLANSLAEMLPFKDASFQSAILLGVLHHMEKAEPVLAEAARVLGSSGLLIVAEPFFPFPMRHLVNAVLSVYPITGDRRFYAPARVTRLAERAGFEKINVIKIPLAYILVFQKCCN